MVAARRDASAPVQPSTLKYDLTTNVPLFCFAGAGMLSVRDVLELLSLGALESS